MGMDQIVRKIAAAAIFTATVCASAADAEAERDCRIREYISPVKILWKSSQDSRIIGNEEILLRPGSGQAVLGGGNVCTMYSSAADTASVLLDFGKELQGGIQIVTGQYPSGKPSRLRIRLGESASEAMYGKPGYRGATNDHAIRDYEVHVPWLGVSESGNSGFRFARIDLLDTCSVVHIKEIRAISVYRDIPYAGSFSSSDARLDSIWQTGAYTVHLNMQEYLWDGIKRDRLVWVGDLHPEVMTVNSVFGYCDAVPASLDLIRNQTPLPAWMNGISSYSIWWLIIQRDWYMHHGDRGYLEQQRGYIRTLVSLLSGKVSEDGHEHLDGMRFLDWPSNANPEAIDAGLHALMILAMDAGEYLCRTLGEDDAAAGCARTRKRLEKAGKEIAGKYLRDTEKGIRTGDKQAAALMVLAGMADPDKAAEKILSVDGAAGFSTFYGFYMLQALAESGRYQECLDRIREYWGAMIDLGATTFWEDFDIRWKENAARIDELPEDGKTDVHSTYGNYCYQGYRHSLCHGWASGPTSWLSRYVLGINVAGPGCRKIIIDPHLGDLEWAEGSFPTPFGIVKVRHWKDGEGKTLSEIEAPDEVEIIR